MERRLSSRRARRRVGFAAGRERKVIWASWLRAGPGYTRRGNGAVCYRIPLPETEEQWAGLPIRALDAAPRRAI
jgi:hypothetical protein